MYRRRVTPHLIFGDNDDVVLVGDDAVGLDGSSGLSCDREHGEYAQRKRASS